MINEGSTALPYEPYGKVWYLNKQIGKVILNGSENWDNLIATNLFRIENYFLGKMFIVGYGLSNYYIYNPIQSGLIAGMINGEFAMQTTSRSLFIKNTSYSTANDFKTWLGNNNVTLYYVLLTPKYTEITDSTLISQLEALNGAKSYTTQTNISQENNDLPFILDVTALKQLT
jgi:hypothetical protein